MNQTELKTDLHQLIENVDDKNILEAIKTILTKRASTNNDWFDELSYDLKAALDESVDEANQGKTISHQEAMQQIKTQSIEHGYFDFTQHK